MGILLESSVNHVSNDRVKQPLIALDSWSPPALNLAWDDISGYWREFVSIAANLLSIAQSMSAP